MVAQKNIIKGAAHGSSGASELKTRKAWLLTSAKKVKSTFSLVGALFLALPVLGLDLLPDTPVEVQISYFEGATQKNYTSIKTFYSDIPLVFFRQPVGMRFNESLAFVVPAIENNIILQSPTTFSYMLYPFKINGTNYNWKLSESSQSIYRLAQSAYMSGFRSPAFNVQSQGSANSYLIMNVDFRQLFADMLFGTNSLYRSQVVSVLRDISSSVSSSVLQLNDISDSLADFSAAFEKVNSFDFGSFDSVVDFASSASYITPSQAQSIRDQYSALAVNPTARDAFEKSTRQFLHSAARVSGELESLLSDDRFKQAGENFNEGLQGAVNEGFSASAHIQGATTNLLEKMTNITDQINKDLEAWRTDATNRLEQQWSGICAVETNTHDTASGVAQIVEHGVKINSPVEVVLGTDFLGVELKVGDIAELIQGFADGSNAAMQRWLDEWEMFKDDQLPYKARFSAFVRDNTNLLSSIEKRLDFGFTNTLDSTYAFLTNGLESAISNGVAGIGLNLTNELWDYYFDRFQKANEFRDDEGQLFSSIDNQRRIVFGNGFDDSEYKKLDWFSRVELLLYQIGYASTNSTESIEASDLEGDFDDVSDEIQTAASAFEGAARRVVGVFSLVGGFAQAVKNAFSDIAAPSTDGILLLEGGSWIVDEPLYLRIPVLIQNALRLVFQCIWYLSAFVIGWRLVSFAWGRVASLVRWLWSLIDV